MNDELIANAAKERARRILDIYGADPARWPAEGRDALMQLIEQDPVLFNRMQEEAALDAVLARAPVAPPTLALQSRILALHGGAEGGAGSNVSSFAWRDVLTLLWPFGSAAVPVAALAIAVVLGGSVGLMTNTVKDSLSEQGAYDVVALALGDADFSEEWQ